MSRTLRSQSHTKHRTLRRKGHTRTPGTSGVGRIEKNTGSCTRAKPQALVATILLLSTPPPVLEVVKVEMKREASIETPLTIIALYPVPSCKRVPH